MAFPDDPLDVTIEAAFGADRTADPGTWMWTDLTSRWHLDEPLTVFTGRKEGARQSEPGDITLVLKNTDGQLTPEDPRSQWWPHVDEGLPIRVTLDPGVGDPLVFGGFVAKLTPRWPSGTPNQALVDLVAGGMIRQYARGRSPLQDSLHRFARQRGALGYWPLSDPEGTRDPVSGLDDLSRLRFSRINQAVVASAPNFGAGFLGHWLPASMVTTGEGGSLAGGRLRGTLPPQAESVAHTFAMDTMYRAPAGTEATDSPMNTTFLVFTANNRTWYWAPSFGSNQIQVTVDDEEAETQLDAATFPIANLIDGNTHHVRLKVSDSTGGGALDADWVFSIDGVTVGSGTFAVGVLNMGMPTGVEVLWFGDSVQGRVAPVHIGHLTVWAAANSQDLARFDLAETVSAAFGHNTEPAIARAQRVSAEEDVALTVVGDPGDSELMGPQPPTTLLELLRECETTDDGILAEQVFGFWIRSRTSRYNQDPALVIDAAQRQLGRAFEPVRDDQRARNEWTVEQAGTGVQVTIRDAVDQQRRGVRDDSLTVNVASPGRLADRAGWELSRSTIRQLRYPTLTVHLHSSPALLEQVMPVRLGDRVQVVNPPRQHPPGPVDQVVEGIQHTITGRRKWTWSAVIAPYAPWQVGVYAGDSETPAPDAPQRYDTAGSHTVAELDAGSDTQLRVSTTLGQLWTVDPADLPLDVRTGGVQLRATDIDLPDPTLRATTGTASGTTGAFTVNSPAGVQAGDLLLLWHAADLATIAEMGNPSGGTWELLGDAESGDSAIRVWWRVAGSSEPGTYGLTQPANADGVAIVAAVQHARPAPAPIRAIAVDPASSANVDTPSTTVHRGDYASLELRVACGTPVGSPSTYTPPGGFVEQEQHDSGGFIAAALATRTTGEGGTGVHTFTTSVNVLDKRGVTINVVGTQQMTVQQQPVNGVAKVIPAGSELSLWTPAPYAL